MTIDAKALRPGTVLRHSSGGTVKLRERKQNGTGWWNTDGSGIGDQVLETSADWSVVAHCPTCRCFDA